MCFCLNLVVASNNDTNPSQPNQHVHEASIASHIDHVQRVSKYMSRFESQIAERGYKLRGNVPSDGNCFFWAISDQLDMNDNANFSQVELRRKAVEHMEQLPQVLLYYFSFFIAKIAHTHAQTLTHSQFN